jgi:hypothetical protein
MIAQSPFMVVAAIEPSRESSLRQLLDSMTYMPGMADADNILFPFGRFRQLHYARFVIMSDLTAQDIKVYGVTPVDYPLYLAFFGDCDGSSCAFLAEAAGYAEAGLRQIFAHCVDFNEQSDVYTWMRAHDLPVATFYVNWLGRTVVQIHEENALQRTLSAKLRDSGFTGLSAQLQWRQLKSFTQQQVDNGQLALTPLAGTSLWQKVWNFLVFIQQAILPTILLLIFLLFSPFLLWRLRSLEKSDPEVCPRVDNAFLLPLKRQEDHDVTNQYTAFGTVKPGLFRRWLLSSLLITANFATRYLFNRGHLARVQTIHFARWVFVDHKSRLIFASNYDGSHEAYMDDFINKVAWGLNLIFSNGIGWPRTDWLVLRGAWTEQKFKYFQRRHQLPTQVWYKAYPGLTLYDINRNQQIRQGIERETMGEVEALAWLRLL